MLGNDVQLVLKGAAQHSARFQSTAHGMTRALEHVIIISMSQAEEFHGQVDLPSEYAVRLNELAQRSRSWSRRWTSTGMRRVPTRRRTRSLRRQDQTLQPAELAKPLVKGDER